jgi:protein-tyrosine phosphatase
MVLSGLKRIIPRLLKRGMRRAMQNVWDSARYHLSVQRFDGGRISHVIFVCKGNICRSAFAEYYLRQHIPDGEIRIESCGLDVDQGIFSPPEAVGIAKEFQLDLELHRSKGFASCDFNNADLILPMEYDQYRRLIRMFPGEDRKIRLLRDFSPWPERIFCNINDPFGSGENEFRRCFGKLKRAIDGVANLLGSEGAKKEQ